MSSRVFSGCFIVIIELWSWFELGLRGGFVGEFGKKNLIVLKKKSLIIPKNVVF